MGTPTEVASHRLQHARGVHPAWVQRTRAELRGEPEIRVPRERHARRQIQPIVEVVFVENERAFRRRPGIEAGSVSSADADLPIRRAPDEAGDEAGADRREQLLATEQGTVLFGDGKAGRAQTDAEQQLTLPKRVRHLQVADRNAAEQAILLRAPGGIHAAAQRILLEVRRETEAPAPELQLKRQVQEQEIEAFGLGQLGAISGVPEIRILDAGWERDADAHVVIEVPIRVGGAGRGGRRVDGLAFRAVRDGHERAAQAGDTVRGQHRALIEVDAVVVGDDRVSLRRQGRERSPARSQER
ncbi:MAG: hypothetical protein K0R38_930 [Polyangiaceae bacterium]|nr:hypothetical protein [Polyangiaceae bacterium]